MNILNNMAVSFGIDVILNWEQTFIFTEVLSLRMPTGQGKRKMLAGITTNHELQNFSSAPLASL
jgi:hypothetical protein